MDHDIGLLRDGNPFRMRHYLHQTQYPMVLPPIIYYRQSYLEQARYPGNRGTLCHLVYRCYLPYSVSVQSHTRILG